jgi:hypothetical protein
MTTPLTIKDTHPTIDFTSITQAGIKAYNLALAHKAEIDPCLPGTIDALSNDLDALGAVVPGALQARHEARAATHAQNALLRQGHTRVRAIRKTVRRSGAPEDVQRAYGVGQYTNWKLVRDVKAALQQIVDRAFSAPSEAAGFGLAPSVVTALNTFLKALTDADMTQEEKRASAPLSTKERNLTGNRILKSTVLIAGAGMLAFADDPPTLASFEALMASTKKTAKPKTAKSKVALPDALPDAMKQPDAPPAP